MSQKVDAEMSLVNATEDFVRRLAAEDAELDKGSRGNHRDQARKNAIALVLTHKMENVYVDEYVRAIEA
jgi:hypothetical protein